MFRSNWKEGLVLPWLIFCSSTLDVKISLCYRAQETKLQAAGRHHSDGSHSKIAQVMHTQITLMELSPPSQAIWLGQGGGRSLYLNTYTVHTRQASVSTPSPQLWWRQLKLSSSIGAGCGGHLSKWKTWRWFKMHFLNKLFFGIFLILSAEDSNSLVAQIHGMFHKECRLETFSPKVLAYIVHESYYL